MPDKLDRIATQFEQTLFVGSSHIPGVFMRDENQWQFVDPKDDDEFQTDTHEKLICTVGSVGQPRGGDWHACFVILDGNRFRFCRVEYDMDTTRQKIKDDPETFGRESGCGRETAPQPF